MFKWSNDQMFKCSNVQMFKCSNAHIFKCLNVPMLKCWNFQMFKCSNAQFFKCFTIQKLLCAWKTTPVRPQAERWGQCPLETLSGWTSRGASKFFNEANWCIPKLPCQTSEWSCEDWDVKSWLHDELKVGVPPGTFDQGCSSGWSPRGARGRGGPQARWKRQRPWREERRSSRSKKKQKPRILGRAQSAAIANSLWEHRAPLNIV